MAEYTYNGVGHLIGYHQDTEPDGDVDGDDEWYYHAYDEGWRLLATFREDDSDPKEEFVLQQAGADGLGGSSYINGVVCRYKDANTAWTSASDGTLEQQVFYGQNWRGDVSALLDDQGRIVEADKYSSYGVPFGLPGADTDSDGDNDATDATNIQTIINASGYDVRADADLDGDVDSTDKTRAQNTTATHGFEVLTGTGNRLSFAGALLDPGLTHPVHHERNRALDNTLGRWISRDALGYVDGLGLYEYVSSRPTTLVDPQGLEEEGIKCPGWKVDITFKVKYRVFSIPAVGEPEWGGEGLVRALISEYKWEVIKVPLPATLLLDWVTTWFTIHKEFQPPKEAQAACDRAWRVQGPEQFEAFHPCSPCQIGDGGLKKCKAEARNLIDLTTVRPIGKPKRDHRTGKRMQKCAVWGHLLGDIHCPCPDDDRSKEGSGILR